MAFKYKGALCIGRSHGVHAEPTSFGLKMTGFYAEFVRHRARIADAIEDIRVGKISGAVGTYTIVSPSIEKKALDLSLIHILFLITVPATRPASSGR